jgi:phosphatidylserine/phosphatidylglycerophosphate/cardiolipin synthase-like enzyme
MGSSREIPVRGFGGQRSSSLFSGMEWHAPTVHYAPAENLEHIDVGLIDGARREIDFAAYVLTDWPIMQALTRAAERGVKVRMYLACRARADKGV